MAEYPSEHEGADHQMGQPESQSPPLDRKTVPPQQKPACAENKKSCNKWWQTNDFPMFVVTLLGVFAVIAYTCVSHQQLTVMEGQLDDAKQARLPFLSVKEIQIVARETSTARMWETILIWENTGGTEAINVSAKTTWFEVTPGATGERHVLTIPEFFLAPHLLTDATRFSIPDDLLKMVRSGRKQITVQWVAVYWDKFGADRSSGSVHETRQGWILNRIDDDPDKIKINNPIKVSLAPQPDFTCVDRGCQNANQ
jgi:hypothetical protein